MIKNGLDNLLSNYIHLLRNKRVGLLSHPAAVTSDLVPILTALRLQGIEVVRLFGPEHGYLGEAQDMEAVANKSVYDNLHSCHIPQVSLYGRSEQTLSPSLKDVSDLDFLVVDLVDVGSRYYTFVWTILLALRVCDQAKVPMMLLDRPNPLGGVLQEGTPQDPDCCSFVGLLPVPVRHGLTPGEIIRLAARRERLSGLHIIPMVGWQRAMTQPLTGVPFVAPSPNMPNYETARVYPGLCLLEATTLSEGRGTTAPFLQFGAPGIDPELLCEQLSLANLPGVRFRPVFFRPMFQKWANVTCGGAFIHVTDETAFRPYRTGLTLLHVMKTHWGHTFEWRPDPYEFVADRPALDLLTGSSVVRQLLEQGAPAGEIVEMACPVPQGFVQEARQSHLYE